MSNVSAYSKVAMRVLIQLLPDDKHDRASGQGLHQFLYILWQVNYVAS